MHRVAYVKPDFPVDAFAGTAPYYVQYRVPYPAGLLQDLRARAGSTPSSLDGPAARRRRQRAAAVRARRRARGGQAGGASPAGALRPGGRRGRSGCGSARR